MSDQNRRADDSLLGKAIKLWPLITSIVVLVGAAYVTRDDVLAAKEDIKTLSSSSTDHEKRLIRIEEAVISLSENSKEMRADLKEINTTLLRMARRHEN